MTTRSPNVGFWIVALGLGTLYFVNRARAATAPSITQAPGIAPGTMPGMIGQATIQVDDEGNVSYYDVAGRYIGYMDTLGVFHPSESAATGAGGYPAGSMQSVYL